MKLASIYYHNQERLAIYQDGQYFLTPTNMPQTMADYLAGGKEAFELMLTYHEKIASKDGSYLPIPDGSFKLLPPVPKPTSCRDGYAFRQHVASARRNRGVDMIPEFDQYPIFYFTNHNAIVGPGDVTFMPDHFKNLDFELEAAIVIGKHGKNVKAADADDYIAGYMVMNDWSARTLQMEEMLLNLGPAKGKDFATGIGPWLVTPDELQPYLVDPKEGHEGNTYKLAMKGRVNGVTVSEGNLADMDWTFAEIIERVSYGVEIFPGDVIGSGTVGTGCFLELNGTAKLNNPSATPQWLQPNDTVEMEIEVLGTLQNKIHKENTEHSIMALKKMPESAK